ncbi:hypothetical protein [Komagataeibacter diospyri]|uniref:hypothetical protein n=1 Tax=Komagataeibacter diospyri TaxID=1932662 RepID=UPI0012B5145E|nr:hypothetical protein [Komagataeibacter diospyri]
MAAMPLCIRRQFETNLLIKKDKNFLVLPFVKKGRVFSELYGKASPKTSFSFQV